MLLDAGYEDSVYLINPSYDDALIGVSYDGRAIYDYEKMVEWLIQNEEDWDETDAIEWIDYNVIRGIPYMGPNAPIVMYRLQ